jgi:protoporphyrinogen IX oxidase
MLNALYFFKALHVVGFVAWFAGLFYLVRMFVYHEEAAQQEAPQRSILQQQFILMQRRVYGIICQPAMVITWLAGLAMLAIGLFSKSMINYLDPSLGTAGWMYIKLLLLALLTIYHLWSGQLIGKLAAGQRPFSSWQYRLLNEFPTIFLAAISFIAVYGKMGALNYFYLFGSIAAFVGLLYFGARKYRKARAKQS